MVIQLQVFLVIYIRHVNSQSIFVILLIYSCISENGDVVLSKILTTREPVRKGARARSSLLAALIRA